MECTLRACLHGGGGPPIGEVTCGKSPHLSCKRDQIKMRVYMDRWVIPAKRVTSPTCGPPPPCKQALRLARVTVLSVACQMFSLDTKMRIFQVERLGCVMLKVVNLDIQDV